MTETLKLEQENATPIDIAEPGVRKTPPPESGFGHKVKRYFIAAVVQCTILYVAFAPLVAMPLYSMMLFHPDRAQHDFSGIFKQMKAMFGVVKQDVYFQSSNGTRLHGYYFNLPGAKKTVLLSHGNGGNIEGRLLQAAVLLKCGVSVLLYDYQGYGQSDGSPSIKGICDDGVAAFDYLTTKMKVAPGNIVIYGESLGSAVTCETARVRQPGGVIIDSGFDSLQSVGSEKLIWLKAYPNLLFPNPRLDNGQILAGKHAPLLILHGKKDQLIPPSHAQALYEQASEPKKLVILEKCGHGDMPVTDLNNYFGSLKRFIDSLS